MSDKETKKKQDKKTVLNFSQVEFAPRGASYFQSEGVNYKSPEATKQDLNKENDIKRCSPMDDYETAVKWVASLTEDELKHYFIKSRVDEVKKKWGIEN